MPPTILIVGATGNTGRGVVSAFPTLLKATPSLSSHRILALTRSLSTPLAQTSPTIPNLSWEEQNWVEITADWLRTRQVERIFIAPHNEPAAFAEEGQFLLNALRAGVKYVVRISPTVGDVRSDSAAYYPRTHWAIEAMLETKEFERLMWTSLQPNGFYSRSSYYKGTFLYGAVAFIKQYRDTGKQGTLTLMISADGSMGLIDSNDVGVFAAHLLSQADVSQHNHAKYVLNGPEDVTGEEIVKTDLSMLDSMVSQTKESKNVISSIKDGIVSWWRGEHGGVVTSRQVLEIAAPSVTAEEALRAMVEL